MSRVVRISVLFPIALHGLEYLKQSVGNPPLDFLRGKIKAGSNIKVDHLISTVGDEHIASQAIQAVQRRTLAEIQSNNLAADA
ncbi:MAG: hypothetical protein ABW184_09000 [Sphingobium sp.]